MTSTENGIDETITLGFDKGGLVMAESTTKRLEIQLGKVLVMTGRLTEEQREIGLALQKETLEHLGRILCREKFCTEQDISDAVHVQMKRLVFTLLHWEEGTYVFELQDALEFFYEFVTPLKITRLLMEGAVIMDEWPRIEQVIHSLDMVFRHRSISKRIELVTEDDSFDFDGKDSSGKAADTIQVTAHEETVFQLIDGKRSIQEVLDQTILSEFACCKAFFELIQKGLIEMVSAPHPIESERTGGLNTPASKTDKVKSEIEHASNQKKTGRWGVARALIQGKLPTALVLGMTLSDKKATLLQGKTDPALWGNLTLPLLDEIGPLRNGTPVGAFEYIENNIGLALFWHLPRDYMLVVSTTLIGKNAPALFRTHVATVARSIIRREQFY